MNTTILHWLSDFGVPVLAHEWLYWAITLTCVVFVVYFVDLVCRRLLIPAIRKVTNKTNFKWDDIVLNNAMLKDMSRLVPPVLLAILLPIIFMPFSEVLDFLLRVNYIYLVVVVAKLICTFLASLYDLSLHHERLKNHSLQSVYQMLKVLIICVALIIVVSILINKNPGYILTALGASAAVLMLVFKDMIVGLVAGVQLSVNDMLRPGDWIAMPKYGADGDVIEVSLTTVKVQNWDKTITTIPPYALVSDSFQNWRGMQESGGRRVKRAVYIDMRSIQFCTEDQMKEFEAKGWFDGVERVDGFPVNLHIFRNYLEKYLRNHPRVNQNMTIMVRQLQPTAQGLPLELYFFSDGTAWIPYEQLQSEIFEHVFAMLPTFGLRIFQSPMGIDFSGESFS
ncbi:MAG: mechanosensitive ion channel [Paludibacteraceae bacterium]|jgi:miniconductance mechanosensitive channel|nr:mechanosensitive ion channel [Paludibacteraceae bacterium]